MERNIASGIESGILSKSKKTSVRCRALDSNLGPLVYEPSVLSIELSFLTKIQGKLMTIYT